MECTESTRNTKRRKVFGYRQINIKRSWRENATARYRSGVVVIWLKKRCVSRHTSLYLEDFSKPGSGVLAAERIDEKCIDSFRACQCHALLGAQNEDCFGEDDALLGVI